ncbi:MAG: nickel-dependent hydrogenase large subunit [Myxococcales bacterium]|nr:nickel-dependent hydrogenase large subunit [Myxococcales bacterium]
MKDGVAQDVRLSIFEPPRFYEGFLRGRGFREVPDITARICGICPVAYQMSSCQAMEDALGWVVPEPLQRLRRLLYCGEWIESHALHMFMLHAPDFLGVQDVVALAELHPEWVKAALHIKKTGNELMRIVGGREIHPINVRVGGFYRAPRKAELAALLPDLESSLQEAQAALPWLATFDYPELERDWELVTLKHPEEYPFCRGNIVSSHGIDVPFSGFPDHFEERHMAHSNALHAVVKARGHYHTGPMARFNLCFDTLGEAAKASAAQVGLTVPCMNPFKSLLVRGVELIQALDEAVRIVADYRPPSEPFVEGPVHAGTGHGASEAPRGMLYHRYTIDDAGLITDAVIVPPTAQNQGTIEDDLRALAPQLATLPLEDATWRAEQAVRNYDPCISCATHFLKLRFEEAS